MSNFDQLHDCGGPILRCPECHQPTDSLKHFRMFDYLLFLFIAFSAQTSNHTACPGCMRRRLLLSTLVNFPLANVLWPIIVLPWNLILFAMSFTKGHSGAVRKICG